MIFSKSIQNIVLLKLLFLPFLLFGQHQPYSKTIETSPELSPRFNHIISGQAMFLPQGVPFEGLKIAFSDVGEAIVQADGSYSMEVPRHWSGFATPYVCEAPGYSFSPPQIEYVDVRFDFSNQNYNGQSDTVYKVSGKFTDKANGLPLSNVEIKFLLSGINGGDEMFVTTNDEGEYSFERPPCWGDTLDPHLSGYYYFEPTKRAYYGLGSDLSDQDFEVTNYEYPVPDEWQTVNTGTFAFVAVEKTSEPDICGNSLQIGDLLGVFYTDDNGNMKCGGFGRWQDESNVFISPFGDDNTTSIKDGFASFEDYTWRFYSYEMASTFPANIEVILGPNYWSNLGLSKVGSGDGYYKNVLWIPKGWSGISSYTVPGIFPAYITGVTQPIANELVIIQDMEKMYYPEAGINTMLFWKSKNGYKIKLSEDAFLPMNGCPDDDRSIELSPTWNLIPVLSENVILTSELFAPFLNQLIIVKEIGGTKLYWPEMGINTLQVLMPGKAYFVAVNSDITIDFADNEGLKTEAVNSEVPLEVPAIWNTVNNTASSHVIGIHASAVEGFDPGDFLGAFTPEGRCAGCAQITGDRQNLVLSVFGEDFTSPEIEGFLPDEKIGFKIYRQQTGIVDELNAKFSLNSSFNDGYFHDNGLSLITGFENLSSSSEELGQSFRIYPNPATDHVKVSWEAVNNFNILIQNLNNETLLDQAVTNSFTINLSTLPPGIYILKAESTGGTIVRKLVLK